MREDQSVTRQQQDSVISTPSSSQNFWKELLLNYINNL